MANNEDKLLITIDGKDNSGPATKSAADGLAHVNESARKTNQEVGELDKKAQGTGFGFNKLATAIGSALAADRVADFIGELVSLEAEYGKLRASVNTVATSSAEVDAIWQKIQSFQADAPIYSVQQVTEAFIKLQALGLDPSEAALRSYGNTSAAMGKDVMQFVEAVADAVTGEFERLKEFGIKASAQGNEVAFTFQGVTTKVGNNAKEIEKYLQDIGNTKFSDGIANQVKEAAGALGELKTAAEKAQLAIADTSNVKGALGQLSQWVNETSDTFVALDDTAGKSVAQLQDMHDAIVRMIALRQEGTDPFDAIMVERYRDKLREVNALMEIQTKHQERAGETALQQAEATRQAAQAADEHARAMESAAEKAKAASKAATEYSASLESTFNAQRGLIEADKEAALASGDVQTALKHEGELRKLAVQQARDMVTAREAERQKAMELASALHAQQAATKGGDDKLKEAIATAEKDLLVKQQQVALARTHAAALDKLPDSLSKVTRQQELTNEQVGRYEEAAKKAIYQAQISAQALKENKISQAEYTQATDEAQQALGAYTAALKLHTQQLEAKAAAASRETSLDQQRAQVQQADIQARIAAAKAAGDEATAIDLGIQLKKAEAAAAQQLANNKAAEAQAMLASVDSKAKEFAADGQLTSAEQEAIQAARDHAEAKRLEAKESQAAANIKRSEASATEQQAEAAKKAAKASKEQQDAQKQAADGMQQATSLADDMAAQLAQYGQRGVEMFRDYAAGAKQFGDDWRALGYGEQLKQDAQNQTEAVKQLTANIQSAVDSGQNLAWAAAQTTAAFTLLDEQKLSGLQAAIASAQQKLAEQQAAIASLSKEQNQSVKDYFKSVNDATQKANEEAGKAGVELTNALSEVIAKAGQDAAQVAEDFGAKMREIKRDSRDFNADIDAALRGISRDGMSDAERRADLVKELHEKTKAVQDAIRAGDLELAQQLRDSVLDIAKGLDQAVQDTNGHIVLSREKAAQQAAQFLEESRKLNAQIAQARQDQAEAEQKAALKAIEERKRLDLAAARETHEERKAQIFEQWELDRAEARKTHKERMDQLREEAAQQGVDVQGLEQPAPPPNGKKPTGISARARGGPVEEGKPYLVIEEGSEPYITDDGEAYMLDGDGPTVFVPPKNGVILPHGSQPAMPRIPRPTGGDAGTRPMMGDAGPRPYEAGPDRPGAYHPEIVPVQVHRHIIEFPNGKSYQIDTIPNPRDLMAAMLDELDQARRRTVG